MRLWSETTSPSIQKASSGGLSDGIIQDMVESEPDHGYDFDSVDRYGPSLVDSPIYSSGDSTDSGEGDEFNFSETTELSIRLAESLNTKMTDLPFVSRTISNGEHQSTFQSNSGLEEARETTTEFRSTNMDTSEGISTVTQVQPFKTKTSGTRATPDGNTMFSTGKIDTTDGVTGEFVENVVTFAGKNLPCTCWCVLLYLRYKTTCNSFEACDTL